MDGWRTGQFDVVARRTLRNSLISICTMGHQRRLTSRGWVRVRPAPTPQWGRSDTRGSRWGRIATQSTSPKPRRESSWTFLSKARRRTLILPQAPDAVTVTRGGPATEGRPLGIHSNETAIGLLGRRGERARSPLPTLDRNSRTKIHALLAGHPTGGSGARQSSSCRWPRRLCAEGRTLRRAAKDEAYRLVYAWYLGFMDDLLALATQAVAERGLLTVGWWCALWVTCSSNGTHQADRWLQLTVVRDLPA